MTKASRRSSRDGGKRTVRTSGALRLLLLREISPACQTTLNQKIYKRTVLMIYPAWKPLSDIFMRRPDFQSDPHESKPSRWETTAPVPDSPWIIPRHTPHWRTRQSKVTYSSCDKESDQPSQKYLDGQSFILPQTSLLSPPQSQKNFTCTQCIYLNYT